jgi:hypothetical protein
MPAPWWRVGCVLYALAGQAVAEDVAPGLEAYLRRYTGNASAPQCHHIADSALPQGRRVFGLVEECTSDAADAKRAWVFVADSTPGGQINEQVLSKAFDFAGSRHYVELTQAQGAERFSVQINYRGGCGTSFDRYRFALKEGGWVVAGRDSQHASCGARGEGAGASREERSVNFLTGRVEERDYQHGKLVSQRTHVDTFPRFALSDFDPFDDAYGPR